MSEKKKGNRYMEMPPSSPPDEIDLTEATNSALTHFKAGDMALAEQGFRQIIRRLPLLEEAVSTSLSSDLIIFYREIYNNLGVCLHLQDKIDEAILNYRLAIDIDPEHADSHSNMGVAMQRQGKMGDAATTYRRALELNPGHRDANTNFGALLIKMGRLEEAALASRHWLEITPNNETAIATLGNALYLQGHLEEAGKSFRDALALNPQNVMALGNLGAIYMNQGKLEEAESACRKALELAPEDTNSLASLGAVLLKKGHFEESEALCRQVIEFDADNANSFSNLGAGLMQRKIWDEAALSFREAIRLEPGHLAAHFGLATVYWAIGDDNSDKDIFERALVRWPDNAPLRLLVGSRYPAFATIEDIDRCRQDIAKLMAENNAPALDFNLDETLAFARPLSFYMAFHGRDDLKLKSQWADLYQSYFSSKFPQILDFSPQALSTQPRDLPRIGFFTTASGPFTIWLSKIVQKISKEKFQVTIICPKSEKDFFENQIGVDAKIDYFFINPDFESAIQEIRSEGFDAIVYHEVGTDPTNYFLPFFRLAPVQCTSFAYGYTTGLPSIDYFLSSEFIESDDSDRHYREKLVRFQSLGYLFERPPSFVEIHERELFGFSEGDHIYGCYQNLFKIHPEHDALIGEILRRDPQGLLAIIDSGKPNQNEALMSRFMTTFPDCIDRVKMLPRQEPDRFFSLLRLSNVLLDSLHLGGGTTTLDSLSVGTPIVTWPGEFARGRFTSACYRLMGIENCTARAYAEYVEIALRLANSPAERDATKEKILAANHLIFENDSAALEWEAFFEKTIKTYN
ncbi:MAG: tetratricopeptide repeat protein [Nitrospinaceae bacterium]|nr:tetratricopeptide repeat protein [Nitrospinaceae bacterium]MBT3433079.1 tetratricopeptide repeat protein [Nitrospinaceae bacterium]MBT3820033.1 tetratricopeptide repeat protein [Nitrospinaceae bacterium]MBT6394423.1 tetratricopeptide repeat protein [Nitrospinaceae bacterium]